MAFYFELLLSLDVLYRVANDLWAVLIVPSTTLGLGKYSGRLTINAVIPLALSAMPIMLTLRSLVWWPAAILFLGNLLYEAQHNSLSSSIDSDREAQG